MSGLVSQPTEQSLSCTVRPDVGTSSLIPTSWWVSVGAEVLSSGLTTCMLRIARASASVPLKIELISAASIAPSADHDPPDMGVVQTGIRLFVDWTHCLGVGAVCLPPLQPAAQVLEH